MDPLKPKSKPRDRGKPTRRLAASADASRPFRIYRVSPSARPDALAVASVFDGPPSNGPSAAPTAAAAVTLGGKPHLLLYDGASGDARAFALSDAADALTPAGTLQIGAAWDAVEPFTLGNQPYLMCYRQADGMFNVFPLALPLGAPKPYTFNRTHEPGVTKGFTTVKPFTANNGLAFLGYVQADGRVAMYTLAVTPTPAPGVAADAPPLLALCVWAHQWAKGWTRFAFFQFGGHNFFLKTNVVKPNVNIDHVLDGLTGGTVEVATQMTLEDSQQLDVVAPLTLGHGEPHFIAYQRRGKAVIYRIHGDCLDWTKVAEWDAPAGAEIVAPFRVNADAFILFC